MAIAEDTSESQIGRVICAGVLQADDVIDLATQKRVVFMNESILTALLGTRDNKGADLLADAVTHG